MSREEIRKEKQEEVQPSLSELLQIRRDKLRDLQEAGKNPYEQTRFDKTASAKAVKEHFESLEGKDVAVAGRIMAKRGMGKAIFADIMDSGTRLQIYVRLNDVGEETFSEFRKYDIGDIIGTEGTVFKTKMGEISLHCKTVTLLSKSLRPLPEKFHGLTDVEARYRKRYLDLIMNPEIRRTFEVRSAFISHTRRYLDNLGYMEVETPVLNLISGGATARPFITHHNSLNLDMYLRIATELNLKRLIVGGIDKVYEIGRIFRNEGMDTKHNPEFTTIELYEAYTDYRGMMEIAEGLLSSAAIEICKSYKLNWLGNEIDMTPGWKQITMIDAVKEYTGLDFNEIKTDEEAVELVKAKKVDMKDIPQTWGNALYECFDQLVEQHLVQPTFITMYPVDVSPLSKRCKDEPRLTERFELFICGCEFGNAFSELNDPIDQRLRFEDQVKLRESGDEEAGMMDEDFILALEHGMPPTGGMGIGMDRAVMLLTDNSSIRDVILFPTMKPLD